MGEKIELKDIKKKKKRETKSSFINVVIFVILFVSIIGLCLASYTRTKNVDILKQYKFLEKYIVNVFDQKQEKLHLELDFDFSKKPKVVVYRGNIAQCQKEQLKIYDSNGKLQNSMYINFKSPLLKANGNYLVIADIKGNKVVEFEGTKKKWEKIKEGNIINVDVNKNGFVTVVNKGSNVLSEATVYDKDGKECITFGKAQNYIINAKVSNNNKKVVLNCLDTKGVKLNSIFEFIDIKGKSVKTMVSHEDTVFLDMKFIKDDNLVALTGDEIIYYNSENQETWRKELNKKVYCFNVCDNKYIVVGMASDKIKDSLFSDKTEVKILNAKGQEVNTIKVDNIVKNISVYDDVIALNLGKEVMFYTSRGRYIKKMTSKLEVDKVEFINKSTVGLVTKSKIIIKN